MLQPGTSSPCHCCSGQPQPGWHPEEASADASSATCSIHSHHCLMSHPPAASPLHSLKPRQGHGQHGNLQGCLALLQDHGRYDWDTSAKCYTRCIDRSITFYPACSTRRPPSLAHTSSEGMREAVYHLLVRLFWRRSSTELRLLARTAAPPFSM